MFRVIKSNFLNYFRLFNSGIGSLLSSFIKKKYLFYSFLLLLFFTIYVLILNQIKNYAELKQNNFNTFLKSNEFNNIKNYIFKNLNSPYQEFTHTGTKQRYNR
jgi:ABC-type glycerol-3-phosphate transport system permease component